MGVTVLTDRSKRQITIRLEPEEKTAFDSYAALCGLGASELAQLLIERERRLQRLLHLKPSSRPDQPERQPWGKALRKPTVTAHLSSSAEVEAFDNYAARCGLIRQTAGHWLLTSELKQKWLDKALSAKAS